MQDTKGWLNWPITPAIILFAMISLYLVVDSANGFLVQQIGINARLSQLYKMTILFLGLYNLIRWQSRFLILIPIAMVILSVGPMFRLFTDPGSTYFAIELTLMTRVLLFLTVLFFCLECREHEPQVFDRWAPLTLKCAFFVIVINVMLGLLGFGFPTYENSGLGFKGFFLAGNELSAVFILVSTFVLHEIWNRKSRWHYLLGALLVIAIGTSIATKAGILFSFLVVVVLPIANYRGALLSLKPMLILLCFVALAGLGIYYAYEFISASPAFGRAVFYLQKSGWMGLIFTGRDLLTATFWSSLQDHIGIVALMFGSGSDAINWVHLRTFVEIDPVDVMMYFGLPATVLMLMASVRSVVKPLLLLNRSYYSPFLLVANGALFFFAILAGHVWTSGMLVIAWGVALAMLRDDSQRVKNTVGQPSS